MWNPDGIKSECLVEGARRFTYDAYVPLPLRLLPAFNLRFPTIAAQVFLERYPFSLLLLDGIIASLLVA